MKKKLVFAYIFLITVSLWILFPIFRVISVSFREGDMIFSTSLKFIPDKVTLQNYRDILFNYNFSTWVWNSIIITFSTSILGLAIASFSAYGLSRWPFKGRNIMLIVIFFTQLLPGTSMIIGIFILINKLGLINTYTGIILTYSIKTVPFSIWILRGYYQTIPYDIEEAAMIDGAKPITIFFKIILPLASPAFIVIFILNFISGWNEFILARVILLKPDMLTWPVGMTHLSSQYVTAWGAYTAGSILIATPVVIMFILASKYITSGLTLGAVTS